MKEAAGEANMTVITIVLIGVVAAVGAIVIPRLLASSEKKAACAAVGGNLNGTTCTYKDYSTNPAGDTKTCSVKRCASKYAKAGEYVCVGGAIKADDVCK